MCDNLRKSEKVVSDVAAVIVIDYAEELRESGLTKEQVRLEVAKYLKSPKFIEAVKAKVEEYIAEAKFEEPIIAARLN